MAMMILGGGVAGISAAYHAQQVNMQYQLYEARASLGGLLDNFAVEGYRFDHAVHLSFTQSEYVRSIFDQTDFYTHAPDATCFDAGVWLKHPVQNNLYPLPAEEKVRLISSLIQRNHSNDPQDYYQWLLHQYGQAISDQYPARYTRKYWGCNPEQLSVNWIGNRMRRADIDEILLGAMTNDTPNGYYAKSMRYPKIGGYKAFLQPMLSQVDAMLNCAAVEIDLEQRWVKFSNGQQQHFEYLLNSIPLPKFIRLCRDVPSTIRQAADALWATELHLVSVGFKSAEIVKDLWFYIYDEDMLAARAYSPSIKSPDNVPQGTSSLQFECYFSRYKPFQLTPSQLCENVVQTIEKMKIASREDIACIDYRAVPYANVVFDHGMEVRRDAIQQFLLQKGVIGIGRFGEWDYLWSDQSLLSGRAGVEKVQQFMGNC